MYTLHIANKLYSSWSLRPWVLMRELSIPFAESVHPFAEGSNWDAFRGFSPSGTVPCLHAGDARIWDSLAIVEYLAEHHAGIWPQEPHERAWARCATAEMHAGFQALRAHCSMRCGLRMRLHAVPDAVRRDIDRIVELWDEGIASFGGPFLAGGTFTAVDAFYAPVTLRFETYLIELPDLAAKYAAQVRGLASMQAWVADALREPWSEPGHEAGIRSVGEVIEDLHRIV